MRMYRAWPLLFVVITTGCYPSSGTTPSADDLKSVALEDVGELYRVHTSSNQKPPASLADFASLQAMQPIGYEALKKGEVIVRYGATMTELAEGPPKGTSDEILAYEKDVPASGGKVLMLDRAVKKMTPEEFKAAKKRGKD